MRHTIRGLGALGAVAGAIALTAAPAVAASPKQSEATPAHAVFVQTDNLAANTVVAYKRSPSGRLTKAGVYPTGGRGGMLEGSVVDHLASQGSLTYDAEAGLLYAVNAGSDTITVFAVEGTKLKRTQVVSSGGEFPVSVSVHGNLVYVLDARGGGAVQGYESTGAKLRLVKSWNRPLGLDPNAAPEFTHTPGQVAFTPDGSKLVVTTKGNTSAVDVFGVSAKSGPAKAPTVTALPEAVPFAVAFDTQGRLLVSEAGPNAIASFTIDGGGHLHEIANAATGQEATCWIAGVGANFYVSNAGSGSVSGYRVSAGGTLTALGNTSTGKGSVDAAVAEEKFLYVQTGAEGLVAEFKVGPKGALTAIGTVAVPGAVGGEGIAAS